MLFFVLSRLLLYFSFSSSISMEAQSLLRLCSKSIIPSVQNRPRFVFSPPYWSFFPSNKSSEIRQFSLKSHSVQRLQCLNSTEAEKAGDLVFNDNELKTEVKRKKLAVFVSGGGSNFRSLHQACLEGLINGDVVVLVTNKGDCGGAEYARNNGIPTLLFPKVKDQPSGLSAIELVAVLRRYEVDFILLAGYLKLIPLELIRAYPKCIVNIHPSLLPAFGGKGYYGMKVHRAVIASGARYTGPTIHFVDEHYDTGRILAQQVVPVFVTDTDEVLAARVLQEEHHLYVKVIAALCEGRIKWREDGVPVIRSKEKPNEYY